MKDKDHDLLEEALLTMEESTEEGGSGGGSRDDLAGPRRVRAERASGLIFKKVLTIQIEDKYEVRLTTHDHAVTLALVRLADQAHVEAPITAYELDVLAHAFGRLAEIMRREEDRR